MHGIHGIHRKHRKHGKLGKHRMHGQAYAQALHDVGSALWFGGSVMGVAGVNKSGADLDKGIDRIRVASSAWRRFGPLQWAGIMATTLAGAQLTRGSKGRLVAQAGFGRTGAAKAAVTVLGAGATAYAAYSGRKVGQLAEREQEAGRQVDVKDASIPTWQTQPELATWQRRQRIAQYLVPVLSGANVVLGSLLVQSYRGRSTAAGLRRRLLRRR